MDLDRAQEQMFKIAPALAGFVVVLAIAVAVLPDRPSSGTAAVAQAPGSGPALVMIETDSCGWCKRFHRDVAPTYAASRYADRAPLVRLSARDLAKTTYRFKGRVTGVPTFILVDRDGLEVDRIRGYPGGPEAFFSVMDKLLDKAAAGYRAS